MKGKRIMDVWAAIGILLAISLINSILLALAFSITYRQSKTEECIVKYTEVINERWCIEAGQLRAENARLKRRVEELEKRVYKNENDG